MVCQILGTPHPYPFRILGITRRQTLIGLELVPIQLRYNCLPDAQDTQEDAAKELTPPVQEPNCVKLALGSVERC